MHLSQSFTSTHKPTIDLPIVHHWVCLRLRPPGNPERGGIVFRYPRASKQQNQNDGLLTFHDTTTGPNKFWHPRCTRHPAEFKRPPLSEMCLMSTKNGHLGRAMLSQVVSSHEVGTLGPWQAPGEQMLPLDGLWPVVFTAACYPSYNIIWHKKVVHDAWPQAG